MTNSSNAAVFRDMEAKRSLFILKSYKRCKMHEEKKTFTKNKNKKKDEKSVT